MDYPIACSCLVRFGPIILAGFAPFSRVAARFQGRRRIWSSSRRFESNGEEPETHLASTGQRASARSSPPRTWGPRSTSPQLLGINPDAMLPCLMRASRRPKSSSGQYAAAPNDQIGGKWGAAIIKIDHAPSVASRQLRTEVTQKVAPSIDAPTRPNHNCMIFDKADIRL